MDLLSMGQYGGYVWTAYALTLFVVGLCIWQARRRHARIAKALRAKFAALENRG